MPLITATASTTGFARTPVAVEAAGAVPGSPVFERALDRATAPVKSASVPEAQGTITDAAESALGTGDTGPIGETEAAPGVPQSDQSVGGDLARPEPEAEAEKTGADAVPIEAIGPDEDGAPTVPVAEEAGVEKNIEGGVFAGVVAEGRRPEPLGTPAVGSSQVDRAATATGVAAEGAAGSRPSGEAAESQPGDSGTPGTTVRGASEEIGGDSKPVSRDGTVTAALAARGTVSTSAAPPATPTTPPSGEGTPGAAGSPALGAASDDGAPGDQPPSSGEQEARRESPGGRAPARPGPEPAAPLRLVQDPSADIRQDPGQPGLSGAGADAEPIVQRAVSASASPAATADPDGSAAASSPAPSPTPASATPSPSASVTESAAPPIRSLTGGAPPAPPTPSAPPGSVDEATQRTMLASVQRGLGVAMAQRGGSVNIRLAPEALGSLRIALSFSAGSVTASFTASSAEAARLLRGGLDSLRESFEARGMKVDRLHVAGPTAPSANPESAEPRSHHNTSRDDGAREHGDGRSRGRSDQQHGGARDQPGPRGSEQESRFTKQWRLALDATA